LCASILSVRESGFSNAIKIEVALVGYIRAIEACLLIAEGRSAAGATPQYGADRQRAVILASPQRNELGIDD
jgi:hypothetical protein